jgi:propanol-preferring alcohol dehydrogenase
MAEIDYAAHLWQEKELKSVANVTRRDIRAFLRVADEAGIRPEIQTYSLEQANQALCDLRAGQLRGAKVLAIEVGDGIAEGRNGSILDP